MRKLGAKSLFVMGLLSLFLFAGIASSCSSSKSSSTMPRKYAKKSSVVKDNYKVKGQDKPRK